MKYYNGIFGTQNICIGLRQESTLKYFGNWLTPADDYGSAVMVQDEDFKMYAEKWKIPDNAYTEYALSVFRVCDVLLTNKSCVFHGAAFHWHEKAFLFTAPSGTGKSTQLFHWCSLYRNDIQIMNGDKPILAAENNEITVYPSPWKGKEGLGNDTLKASLAGIIFLEQGSKNHIARMPISKAVKSLLPRILTTADNTEIVKNAGRMLEQILLSVPVWKLTNTGDLDSAVLTHDTLEKELFSDEI